MVADLVPDGLWDLIEPLLSPAKPGLKGGRPRVPDRACLRGIVFVLRSGNPLGRRLRIRYEKRSDIHEAFLAVGCVLICWRFLDG